MARMPKTARRREGKKMTTKKIARNFLCWRRANLRLSNMPSRVAEGSQPLL
jgi:hypothetical protein